MMASRIRALLIPLALASSGPQLRAQIAPIAPGSADSIRYETVFYANGPLKLEGYLYRPSGDGPFPVVIYSHGSRAGAERAERPFPYIGALLTRAGYAVFVPERRGYGKSDGDVFGDEVGNDRGARFLRRLAAEAEDVLAAVPYLATIGWADTSRVAVMGWSFGGIVTVLAAGTSSQFFAVINQAGASLTWDRSAALQSVLPSAARRIRKPLLCQVAENDATTAAAKAVCGAARANNEEVQLTIYPPFTPTRSVASTPDGHMIFTAEGVPIWGKEVVTFLDRYRPRRP